MSKSVFPDAGAGGSTTEPSTSVESTREVTLQETLANGEAALFCACMEIAQMILAMLKVHSPGVNISVRD